MLNGCECLASEVLIDGRCHKCGTNCSDCAINYCTNCHFGYWLDHTHTLCIDFCPDGTVMSSTHTRCEVQGSAATQVTYVFDKDYDSTVIDPVVQRSYSKHGLKLYGGANETAVERDDPDFIEDRGYWFNGECKFLILKGFTWSMSPALNVWIKLHNYDTTLLTVRDDGSSGKHWKFTLPNPNSSVRVSTSSGHGQTYGDGIEIALYRWYNLALAIETF